MIDSNRHRFYLLQLLKEIYTDIEIGSYLGFKGGTAMMFFYDLPRLSIDLDFDLLYPDREGIVYEKIRTILLKYGIIHDEAKKFHGPLLVLDYGSGERKLKVEISNREFNNRYEIKNLLGIDMLVMVPEDMFAHKLCALLDRRTLANRDLFDCWFFMTNHTPINTEIVESRMQISLSDYLDKCIQQLESRKHQSTLSGIGELLDPDLKQFVKTKLLAETITLMKFYREFPLT